MANIIIDEEHRFSKVYGSKSEALRELTPWVSHFDDLKIETKIAETPDGWALYREKSDKEMQELFRRNNAVQQKI